MDPVGRTPPSDRFVWKTLAKHLLQKAARIHGIMLPGELMIEVCDDAWFKHVGESRFWEDNPIQVPLSPWFPGDSADSSDLEMDYF